MDIVPAPLKQLYYFVVLLPTPRENLQNLICTFSCFMFLLKLNRKRSSLLILLTIDVPHTSLPYNSTGFTVWSNSGFIFGLYKLKLFKFKQCFQTPFIQIFFSFCRAST